MKDAKALLECRGICKSFYRNMVLQDIDLTVKKGSVHALLGQNGAGKSTLVKIITGVYTRDSGEILLEGNPVRLATPQDAEKNGIAIIHQDQQLVPLFDVTRNAFLGSEIKKPNGSLDFAEMRRRVMEKLAFIQADFSADEQILSLTVGQREQVAIVSALLKDPKLLILDEPTASLGNKEIQRLFEIIRILSVNGVTIIYISHHLDEVFEISDRISVLRDSRMVGTLATVDTDRKQVVSMMIGKELKDFYPKEQVNIGDVVLKVQDLCQGKLVRGVSFELRRGEILGFAGLVGAGRTEAMLTLYGTEPKYSGSIWIDGKPFVPKSPQQAHRAGFALIPEDRRNEGIVMGMSIRENLSLVNTRVWARRGIMRRRLEREGSQSLVQALKIKCTDIEQKLSDLSGGNQQKVVIGKWMTADSEIYIFDQPTTGVDVGAKTEIYRLMMSLAKRGCGIIFISSDNEELLGICDRILVMTKGKVVANLPAATTTEHEILNWAAGAEEGEGA
jgi:ABC-type sugar transport system ATPase subunit